MSNEIINPYQTFRDSAGVVIANGTITFLVNTTTTKASIFSDEALTVAQSNPYTLDAYGRITGDVKYKGLMSLLIKDSAGATVRTDDNISTMSTTADTMIVFETVALMVADTNLQVGDHVKTLGYLAIGDGGGNEYDVVAAATGTADGGYYIDLATHQAKGLFPNDRVYLKQFGALLDGTGDQSDEWNNAFAACDKDGALLATGELWLGTGSMRYTSALNVNKRVNVRGPGKFAFKFVPDGTFTAYKVVFPGVKHVGFTIDGSNLTGTLIEVMDVTGVSSSDSLEFDELQCVNGSTHAIHGRAGDRVTLRNVNISACEGDGVRGEGKTGSDTAVSCNFWKLSNVRVNGKVGGSGIGLNLIRTDASSTNNWHGDIICEGNVGGGMQIATSNNKIATYLEDNTAADLTLTSTATGNKLALLAVETVADIVNNATSNDNEIWAPLQGFFSIPSIGNTPPGTAIAGRDVTIAGGATGSTADAKRGGTLFLLGGKAAGTDCNGGHVTINGRVENGLGGMGTVTTQSIGGQNVLGGEVSLGDSTMVSTHTYSASATASVSAITQADPGVATATAHGFSDGQEVQLTGITGMTELENEVVVVTSKDANTFQLYINGGADRALDTAGSGSAFSGTCTATRCIDTRITSHLINSTGGAFNLVLPNGRPNQLLIIQMIADGGDVIVTPVALTGGSTITFNDLNDFAFLYFLNSSWMSLNSTATIV